MKKTLLVTTLVLAITAVTMVTSKNTRIRITPSKTLVTQTLDMKSFKAIDITGVANVTYTQGELNGSITCSDNLLEYLNVYVSSGTLYVKMKENVAIDGKPNIKVSVSSPSLNNAKVSGVGGLYINGALKTEENMLFTVTGVGDIECNEISCLNLDIKVTGTGDIDFQKIDCADLSVDVTGTGDIESKKVNCGKFTARITGAGDVEISDLTSKSVNATISGAGDIKLVGRSVNAEYTVSGAGGIEAHYLLAENVVANASGVASITCYASKSFTGNASAVGSIKYRGKPETVNLVSSSVKPMD